MAEENKDYIDLEAPNPREDFRNKLTEKEREYHAQYKPYDFRNAWIEYKSQIQKASEVLRDRGVNEVELSMANLDIGKFDMEKYGDPKRFTLRNTTEAWESINIGGVKNKQLIGMYQNYIVKDHGNGISIFIPLKVWKERFAPKKTSTVAE